MKKNFSTRLRILREDYTQAEFARKIGAKQTTYSSWERGIKEPSLDMVLQISRQMGVTTDYLLGISESRTGTCAPSPDPAVAAKLAAAEAEIARLNGVIDGLKMALGAVGKGQP